MAEATLATSNGILRFLYDFSHMALTRNIEGLTHADSLLVPPGGGNCANWSLGHVLHNRSFVLGLLHEQPLWSEADGAPYLTGSKPLDPQAARPWDSLVRDLNETQERIRRGLEKLDPDELDRKHAEDAKRPRGAQLHFMQFHESYHAGQIGLLRRMAGKPGAI
jgi:hypothetical protein